jgi:hypothetical protein
LRCGSSLNADYQVRFSSQLALTDAKYGRTPSSFIGKLTIIRIGLMNSSVDERDYRDGLTKCQVKSGAASGACAMMPTDKFIWLHSVNNSIQSLQPKADLAYVEL